MKTKTMPAPRRAGTARREADLLAELNRVRTEKPKAYDRLMLALAEMVATIRAIDD